MHAQDLLSTAQVAERIGKDVSTVSRRVSSGAITPALRIGGGANGGAMFFRPRDVEKLAAVECSESRDAA